MRNRTQVYGGHFDMKACCLHHLCAITKKCKSRHVKFMSLYQLRWWEITKSIDEENNMFWPIRAANDGKRQKSKLRNWTSPLESTLGLKIDKFKIKLWVLHDIKKFENSNFWKETHTEVSLSKKFGFFYASSARVRTRAVSFSSIHLLALLLVVTWTVRPFIFWLAFILRAGMY